MKTWWCKKGERALFLPFCVKAIGTIGITPFQTITTWLYGSLLGSHVLLIVVVNKDWALQGKDAAMQGNHPGREAHNKACAKGNFRWTSRRENCDPEPLSGRGGNYPLEDQDHRERGRGRFWDNRSVALPSSHSREARVEHTCEVMPRWGTRALEPLAREVLDFKRSEEHPECSVEVCHMQKT